jgi:hypothetical protein
MDYGFVPGGTTFENSARRYLAQRSTCQIIATQAGTVESFVNELKTSATVVRPVGNLGIGCHGHPQGILEIKLDSSTAGALSNFDDVDRAATNGTIKIPSAVLDPRPVLMGVPLVAQFRIVGCSIGAAQPYLQRLKTALGGNVRIFATQHEDMMVGSLTINGVAVVIRMLQYDFRIITPLVLEGQEDVIQAFMAKYPKWYDGVSIPREFWKGIIPTDVFPSIELDTAKKGRLVTGVSLKFDPAINGVKNVGVEFDAHIWEHRYESVGPYKATPPAQNLATTTERREFMRGKIKTRPEFAAGHAFPLHKQLGYSSYDAFIDGYDWISPGRAPDMWKGYRNLYRVLTPVTSPGGSNKPLYDVVSTSSAVSHLGLDETDARLFTAV